MPHPLCILHMNSSHFGNPLRDWIRTGGSICEQPDNPRIASVVCTSRYVCHIFPWGMSLKSRAWEQPLILSGSDCSLLTTKGRRKWLPHLNIAFQNQKKKKSMPDANWRWSFGATRWHHLLWHYESWVEWAMMKCYDLAEIILSKYMLWFSWIIPLKTIRSNTHVKQLKQLSLQWFSLHLHNVNMWQNLRAFFRCMH